MDKTPIRQYKTPVVIKNGSRFDPFVAIQRPPPKNLGIRLLCFIEEVFRVMLEFAAEPKCCCRNA